MLDHSGRGQNGVTISTHKKLDVQFEKALMDLPEDHEGRYGSATVNGNLKFLFIYATNSGEGFKFWEKRLQFEQALTKYIQLQKPAIVAGDFNETANFLPGEVHPETDLSYPSIAV